MKRWYDLNLVTLDVKLLHFSMLSLFITKVCHLLGERKCSTIPKTKANDGLFEGGVEGHVAPPSLEHCVLLAGSREKKAEIDLGDSVRP